MDTARDVSLYVTSPTTSSERRITPSWSLTQLRKKLEPVTGIPPHAQKLTLKIPGQEPISIEASNEDETQIGAWGLVALAEILVEDLRPPAERNLDLTDLSSVEKYTMPTSTYETLPDSVLSWKRSQKLGRFDPNAPETIAKKVSNAWNLVTTRNISVGARCRVGGEEAQRRGVVRFVGAVEEIPGLEGAPWVGVELDEPVGKNDGTIKGRGILRFKVGRGREGVFVRPERVEVGEFEKLDDLKDEDMEEI